MPRRVAAGSNNTRGTSSASSAPSQAIARRDRQRQAARAVASAGRRGH